MALVKRQMSRRKKLALILTLAVVVVGGLYYLLQGGTSSISGPSADPVTQQLNEQLKETEGINRDLLSSLEDLFRDVRFLELKQYGTLPVEPGKTGRPNPFLSF